MVRSLREREVSETKKKDDAIIQPYRKLGSYWDMFFGAIFSLQPKFAMFVSDPHIMTDEKSLLFAALFCWKRRILLRSLRQIIFFLPQKPRNVFLPMGIFLVNHES